MPGVLWHWHFHSQEVSHLGREHPVLLVLVLSDSDVLTCETRGSVFERFSGKKNGKLKYFKAFAILITVASTNISGQVFTGSVVQKYVQEGKIPGGLVDGIEGLGVYLEEVVPRRGVPPHAVRGLRRNKRKKFQYSCFLCFLAEPPLFYLVSRRMRRCAPRTWRRPCRRPTASGSCSCTSRKS